MATAGGVAYVGTDQETLAYARRGSIVAVSHSGGVVWDAPSPYGAVRRITVAGSVVYASIYYFEGDWESWQLWAVRASTGADVFVDSWSTRDGWAAVDGATLYWEHGALNRVSGKLKYSRVNWVSTATLANGVLFENRCMGTASQVADPDLPWGCVRWAIKAVAAATGQDLNLPDIGGGHPIVANGRLYVLADGLVRMYTLG